MPDNIFLATPFFNVYLLRIIV